MTIQEIKDELAQRNDEALLADGLDDALIGAGEHFGSGTRAVYDREKVIDILVKRDGMTADEANEHFEFNILGSGVPNAPIFVEIMRESFEAKT